MHSELTREHRILLSTDLAGRREVCFARVAVLVSAVFFCAAVPLGRMPLAPVPAFIPTYESALAICDLITAVLLFGQVNVLRSRALSVLAGGYFFAACIVFSHMLVFPGAFSPAGLLGAGAQSSVWLYVFWHAGFPVFVIVYALINAECGESAEAGRIAGAPADKSRIAVLAGGTAVLGGVCALVFIATAMHDYLPVLLVNNGPTALLTACGLGFCALSIVGLFLLWQRRPRTVIDLWLMVVMCAWIFEVAIFVFLNTSRYDLGWYAARVYGLLAGSSLLIALLTENGKNYARLAQLTADLSRANKSLEQLSMHDALTELANRRFFDMYLAEQVAIAQRHARSLALVLYDADDFKAYNDLYGHPAGDACLQKIAAALRSCCRRPADIAARYGGEEFVMILPDTDLAGATRIAEAARSAVAELKIPHAHSSTGSIASISGGIAILLGKFEMNSQQLVAAADQALYQAKRAGRNRMVIAHAGLE